MMRRIHKVFILCILVTLVASCSTPPVSIPPLPTGYPKISRHLNPASWPLLSKAPLNSIPHYDPSVENPWQVDLRNANLSTLDLSGSLSDLKFANFDTQTIWPSSDKMPAGFDWQQIMELGKNPGLGIRSLHQKGITGSGVGIGMIDGQLLVDHPEYVNQIRLYEEADDIKNSYPNPVMHSSATASIAVGKNVGVAPDADLYFIATDFCYVYSNKSYDFGCLAKSVRRMIEINRQLPQGRKIRVLSISFGWDKTYKGFEEITQAVKEARAEGMFVVCSSLVDIYGFRFQGLGRSPLADPDSFQSYSPGIWWSNMFYTGYNMEKLLLVPMDARTVASPFAESNQYVFYREGGWSWAIPYIAGMYALAAQVMPSITPDEFWNLALQTGQTIQLTKDGKTYSFGTILDAGGLITKLQEKTK